MKKLFIVPHLAHGHIAPLVELSVRLSSLQQISVTMVSTPRNISKIQSILQSHHQRQEAQQVDMLEIPMPQVAGLDPGKENASDLENPQELQLLMKAMALMADSLKCLYQKHLPDCVLSDIAIPQVAIDLGIPSLYFYVFNAAAAVITMSWPEIDFRRDIFNDVFVKGTHGPDSEFRKIFDRDVASNKKQILNSAAFVVNTSAELEPDFIEYFEKKYHKTLIPVGPLLPKPSDQIIYGDYSEKAWMKWLAEQSDSSVLYVAFGSQVILSGDQIREIAFGLEESEVPFLWVLRRGKEYLPQGFEERMKERKKGLVVDEWVPQAKILADSKMGGFMSHCGWSSCQEAFTSGLPVVAVPLEFEQGLNARTISKIVKNGLEVERKADESLTREEISRVVRKLMVDEEMLQVRRNARQIKQLFCEKVTSSGGSQEMNIKRLAEIVSDS
eukprot:TRINITY_DN292_c0_g1_i10.p1 TRINITY_DN292_c0_g1~~TRINITY_DN292_c0_g1_i10.p1  ORF type:complete len:443 (-),score=35.28 TRINITY_DN292_c0_g1_i10:103-1431(-)